MLLTLTLYLSFVKLGHDRAALHRDSKTRHSSPGISGRTTEPLTIIHYRYILSTMDIKYQPGRPYEAN